MKTAYIKQDDRTREEISNTIGFVVANDRFMSGWGGATGKSIVAVPFTDEDDKTKVLTRMERRDEMKYVRVVYGKKYRPKLHRGDHLHIYNTKNSFRYAIN